MYDFPFCSQRAKRINRIFLASSRRYERVAEKRAEGVHSASRAASAR